MRAPHVAAVAAVALLSAGALQGGCTNRAGGGPADAAKGERYFKAKCNACHPDGGQGAGPSIVGKTAPGPLKKGGSGRHGVPAGEWDSLLMYVTPIMNPAAATAAAVAASPMPAPAPAPAPVAVAPAPAPAPEAAPAAPATKTCNCTCQCPAGVPPGQLETCTCTCQCQP